LRAGLIRSWEDFRTLPVTTKEELRARNRDFICIPRAAWAELFVTSGTTGGEIHIPYSERDLERLALQTAGLLKRHAGVRASDVAQLTRPLGSRMWMAGICMWLGLRKIRACTLRMGPGDVEGQVQAMENLGTTIYSGAPSFCLKIAEAAAAMSPPPRLRVRKLIMGNENLVNADLTRNEYGRAVESAWPSAEVFADYGSTELGIIGMECPAHRGYHFPSATVHIEILEPETQRPCRPGVTGVLVATTVGVEGVPLIRYATGDLTFLIDEPCPCGSPGARLGPIVGRTDEMMKVKGGAALYPERIHSVMMSLAQVDEYYFEYYEDPADRAHKIRIFVSLREGPSSSHAEATSLSDVLPGIEARVREMLGFTPGLGLRSREEIERKIHIPGKRKPCRFFNLAARDGKGGDSGDEDER
jgi:phenylacetate-CoA ligase